VNSIVDIIDRIKPPRPAIRFDAEEVVRPAMFREVAYALSNHEPFVLERQNDGHIFLTAPASVRETAGTPFFTRISGDYVEANKPNRNGAMWTSQGLEVGVATVANGPLNWLHEEKHIIGCITDANLVGATDQADDHISVDGVMWSWLWPAETAMLKASSERNSLYLSMECVSESVICVDGCGETFPHEQAMLGDGVCEHVRKRTGIRRFNNPVFLGGAVIVPPYRPGWSKSNAKVEAAIESGTDVNLAVNDLLVYSGALS